MPQAFQEVFQKEKIGTIHWKAQKTENHSIFWNSSLFISQKSVIDVSENWKQLHLGGFIITYTSGSNFSFHCVID